MKARIDNGQPTPFMVAEATRRHVGRRRQVDRGRARQPKTVTFRDVALAGTAIGAGRLDDAVRARADAADLVLELNLLWR